MAGVMPCSARWSRAPRWSTPSSRSRPATRASTKTSRPMTSSSKAPRWLNRLALPGRVWIASDIHPGEHNPGTAAASSRFLQRARHEADALVLCGDIFEAWIGDDHALNAPPAWLGQALAALRDTARDIPLWLGRGNRDFLMGPALARSLGAQLLDDEVLLSTEAGTVLL